VVASAFGVHSDRCFLRRVRTVETLLVVGSSILEIYSVYPYVCASQWILCSVCLGSLGFFISLCSSFRSQGYWVVNRASGTGREKICRILTTVS